jgi:mannose/fructose-specific phosphotransferase system component IIA
MSDVVNGILVGHGKLADGLLDAVANITGSREGLVAVDNAGMTPEALESRIDELIGARPTVVFVDLPSGSCAFAARKLLRRRDGQMALVCGVNLPLLLDFMFHRELPLQEILDRLRSRVGVSIEP